MLYKTTSVQLCHLQAPRADSDMERQLVKTPCLIAVGKGNKVCFMLVCMRGVYICCLLLGKTGINVGGCITSESFNIIMNFECFAPHKKKKVVRDSQKYLAEEKHDKDRQYRYI